MLEIELKSLVATLGATDSLMGVLLLAAALLLFRVTLFGQFGQSLSHIPLLDAELTKAERWKAYRENEKGVYAKVYKKVNFSFRRSR